MDTADRHVPRAAKLPAPTLVEPRDCPVDATLQVIGGRWKALILYNLRGGPRRFNELRRLLPLITQRMLTQHLRELEADGVILRHVRGVVPPHVDYSISPDGESLLPILDAMAVWGMGRIAGNRAEAAE